MTAPRAKAPDNGKFVAWAVGAVGLLLIGIALGSGASQDRQSAATDAHPTAAPAPPATATNAKASSTSPVVSTAPVQAPDGGGLDYLMMKAQAEELLKAKLSDESGVRYRNVDTRLTTLDGGGVVAFCGEVNSKTAFGGYGGFKRFIASRSVATTEDGMTPDDFEQAWSRFCSDGVLGPKVWF